MRNKIVLLLSLFCFITLLNCSKSNIHGIIKDAEDKPIEGINVSIINSDFKTITKKDGSFSFPFFEGNIEINFSEAYFKLPEWCSLPSNIFKDSVTKERYPNGLDIGVLRLPCIIIKSSVGPTKFADETNQLVDNNNGTITVKPLNLMWVGMKDGHSMNWHNAISFCEKRSLAGYEDWKLPSTKEISQIITQNKRPPIHSMFNYKKHYNYWTSTSGHKSPKKNAIYIRSDGFSVSFSETNKNNKVPIVKCIREIK